MSRIGLLPTSTTSPPVDPTAGQARQQLAQELAKPQYQAARPTLLATIEKDLSNWFQWLLAQVGGGPDVGLGPILTVIAIVVGVALLIGFLLFGIPRLNRKSTASFVLFGDEDDRDSAALRTAAERAAASGDYGTAIAELFRSIARSLAERGILTPFPGTTAQGFAAEAALSFPSAGPELIAVADSFDGVRYRGGAGTQAEWMAALSLDRTLREARPVIEDDVSSMVSG